MPSRRALLRETTGGATDLLAGCLSSGATETPTTATATPPDWNVEEPFEEVTVGTPERPSPDESPRYRHQIRVWNRVSGKREVAVRLDGPERTHVDETIAIPVDEQFGIRIYEKAAYTLSVDRPGSDTADSFDVPERAVDCNYSTALVTVYCDDRPSHRTLSTTKECNYDD